MITKIQVVGVGRMKVPGPEVFWMERFDEELALTLWMVVVQTVDRVLLINTGVAANDTAVPELVGGIAGGGMTGLKPLLGRHAHVVPKSDNLARSRSVTTTGGRRR